MKPHELIKAFANALTDRRHQLTVKMTVETVEWDPTFGAKVGSREIEVIDFDALCGAIDEFSESLKANGQ